MLILNTRLRQFNLRHPLLDFRERNQETQRNSHSSGIMWSPLGDKLVIFANPCL